MNNIKLIYCLIQMRKHPQNDLVVIHWLKIDGVGHIQSQKIFSRIMLNQIHHWEIMKQIEKYLEKDFEFKIEKYLENDLGLKIEKYLKNVNRLLPNGLTLYVLWSSLWTNEMFRSHQMMIDMFNGYITFICN